MLSQLLKSSKSRAASPVEPQKLEFPLSLKEIDFLPSLTLNEKPATLPTKQQFVPPGNKPNTQATSNKSSTHAATWPPSHAEDSGDDSDSSNSPRKVPAPSAERRSPPILIPGRSLSHSKGKGIQHTYQLSFSVSSPLGQNQESGTSLSTSAVNAHLETAHQFDLDLFPELDYYIAASFSDN